MDLRYDDDFLEAAVFLCASGGRANVPSLQVARFHRERERLYAVLDPDDRNAAFFRLHLGWFREWGMERPLAAALKEFPSLSTGLDTLAVRLARGKNDTGAELYVHETGRRTAVVALGAQAFVQEAQLTDYLRHEFTHLRDMLDPDFGYAPVLSLPGLNAAQQRVARERYRLLWDITIDGRLSAVGHTPSATREQHFAAFSRAFSFWPESRQSDTFQSLWHNPAPRHAELLALIADPRGLRQTHGPVPGASCPLCDFPTFEWANPALVSASILGRITAEFPTWTPDEGMCGRCLETYQAAAKAYA